MNTGAEPQDIYVLMVADGEYDTAMKTPPAEWKGTPVRAYAACDTALLAFKNWCKLLSMQNGAAGWKWDDNDKKAGVIIYARWTLTAGVHLGMMWLAKMKCATDFSDILGMTMGVCEELKSQGWMEFDYREKRRKVQDRLDWNVRLEERLRNMIETTDNRGLGGNVEVREGLEDE